MRNETILDKAIDWLKENWKRVLVVAGVLLVVVVTFALTFGRGDDSSIDTSKTTTGIENSTPETTAKPENQTSTDGDVPIKVATEFLDKVQAGDEATLVGVFGDSDTYTAEGLADRIKVARVSYTGSKYNGVESGSVNDIPADAENIRISIHICTIDYGKSKEAAAEAEARIRSNNPSLSDAEVKTAVEREIAERTQAGEFDAHYNVDLPIETKDGKTTVRASEAFKQAITGGWYSTGEKLESMECPLEGTGGLGQANNSVLEQYRSGDSTNGGGSNTSGPGSADWNGTRAAMPNSTIYPEQSPRQYGGVKYTMPPVETEETFESSEGIGNEGEGS